ncbi:hypothetical protein EXIGLDRAFT_776849 [Exidia glandulosa HHB12029]|uniref:DUF6534 domain-containing protein n=1 Tax=Exidia glandulosa HHB12029 TaxID=1314781 RepID=A0A165DBB1_EXIGL|nr:hypothetical protein EXIGLDRAFT_776849 [Exidia glandulosa HHB12029]
MTSMRDTHSASTGPSVNGWRCSLLVYVRCRRGTTSVTSVKTPSSSSLSTSGVTHQYLTSHVTQVAFVYWADTVHSLLLVLAVYEYLVVRFGNYASLESMAPTSSSSVLIAGIAAFAVQRSASTGSDMLVDKIVAFTVGSGLLTSIVAVVETITYLTMDNYIFMTLYSITAKLFANSLLASLNERSHMRRHLGTSGWATQQSRPVSTGLRFDSPGDVCATLELTPPDLKSVHSVKASL